MDVVESSAPPAVIVDGDAAAKAAGLLAPEAIDALLADADRRGLAVDGPGGPIQQVIGAVLERVLETEMAEHLGYERGQAPEGASAGNHRNGHTPKTVITTAGPVRIQVPRDRGASFEPKIVPKRRRRLGQPDEAVLSLYARGMSTRDIRDHLAEIYGADVSHETVSNITDVVADEVRTWQNRPLDEVSARPSMSARSGSRSATPAPWSTSPPTWSSASTSTGSNTSSACGFRRPRVPSFGSAC